MTVDIHIKIGTDEYKRLDLFDDETISIKDSIQDIRDIQKVFVPYTSNIVVPASKTNNQVFKHYYNNDIDGFDARFLVDAFITIDGYVYKEGKVRLEKAVVKNNEVYSYSIRFFGETIELTELIGDDKLADLDLTEYNFDYNAETVKSGFQNVDGDLTFPFISAKNYYYYATGTGGDELKYGLELPDNGRSKNVNADPKWDFHGVNYLDLKPAIRVDKLIRKIEDKYDITFTNHFFDTSDPKWDDLHLWLDREKGQLIGNTLTNGEVRFKLDDPDIAVLSDTDVRNTEDNSTVNRANGFSGGVILDQWYQVRVRVAVEADEVGEEYSIEILDGISGRSIPLISGEVGIPSSGPITKQGKLKGDLVDQDFVQADFKGYEDANGNIQPIVVIRSSEIASIKVHDLQLRKKFKRQLVAPGGQTTENITARTYPYQYKEGGLTNVIYTGKVSEMVPDMKILNFLTSIWKTFNLTAYKNQEGEIEVKSLGEYYSSGSVIDLTEYVDTSEMTYERSTLYKSIELKNKEPKVWANKQFDNIFIGESFGDFEVRFDDRNTFTKDYKVQTEFGRIIYERMTDQYNLATTSSIQWGWAVDENKSSVQTDPTLLYCFTQSVANITYDDGTRQNQTLYRYVKPTNVHETTLDSLSFGEEVDEWIHLDATSSLYNNYYKDYIQDTFDIRSRIVSVTAKLPSTILLNYTMNDTVRIENKDYTINTLSANLSTGETQLELLTKL